MMCLQSVCYAKLVCLNHIASVVYKMEVTAELQHQVLLKFVQIEVC